ncbi:hypothetical protein GOP47_0008137 [Adiantum capillus-veneris]|uniref:DNA 3'-5' helicase n=1 Tax=Adiantum capillus-veneris TaxID=13818 RepID=A0A9D4ZJD9_ADICA|nr:hypothetical protein GOP47_0008137 [Adiantum capillus-veneris]
MPALPAAAIEAGRPGDAQCSLDTSPLTRSFTPPCSLPTTQVNSDLKLQKTFSETENFLTPVQKKNSVCIFSSNTSRVSLDSRMPENNLSMAGANKALLPLHIEEVLIPDSDLDENMCMQLDSLSSARAPLMQLSTNRPPEQSRNSYSQNSSQLSCSSMEGHPKTAVLPATIEGSVFELYPPSSSQVDSTKASIPVASEEAGVLTSSTEFYLQEILSSMIDTKFDSLEEADQSCTRSASLDTVVPEQQVTLNVLQEANGLSISCESSCVQPRLKSISETDILVQMSSSTVNTVAVNCLPSSSILESCLGEASADASKMLPAYLQTLNDTQREAVLSDIQKPLLILAGPGSGKTSTMVARLLRLLSEGVQATNILAMTFTTAAATEMKERVGAHVGKSVSKELNVCTFHSFCLQLCRSNAEKLGRSPDFLVYGHGQQRRAVIEATRLALPEIQSSKDVPSVVGAALNASIGSTSDQLSDPRLLKERARKWDKFVTQAKASGQTPEYFESVGNVSGAAVLRHYNATLATCDALDYHDFINHAVALLLDDEEALKQCLLKWTCLLVDEFQDTSKMQYELLRLLGSQKRITVVGDDDQSIFSFNGADSNNFEAFRKDFHDLKEVRLQHNYRSTRCIVEAAAALIGNNVNRCEGKQAVTNNEYGEMISVKECRNDDAQCCFAIDTIIMSAQKLSPNKSSYGNFAILYRRQVTGRIFQTALRSRKIPFNIHGVAFYRKKVVKTIISLLWTALNSDAIYCSRVFKALFGSDRVEAKKVVEYVDKVAKASQSEFLEAARRVFTAKVSGMFSRRQLASGRKVLSVIDAVGKLVRKESSLSTVVTTVVNLIPQRSAFQKRAVQNVDEGKFLNEDDDPRTVMEYLLDDVTDFLGIHFNANGVQKDIFSEEGGCLLQLKLFLEHVTFREHGNIKTRREENKNSVTLTTMHQSKGLEWDTVFIVKANDSEIPLLHEARGSICDGAMSIEEERRLFYVGMTRAKRKLYILYITWDTNQQLLWPTRFLNELPRHLLDYQVINGMNCGTVSSSINENICQPALHEGNALMEVEHDKIHADENIARGQEDGGLMKQSSGSKSVGLEPITSTEFLKGFNVDARSMIALIFHNWAKKPAFQDPKRLLNKVRFVLDERMRSKTCKNKDTLRALKCSLDSDDAVLYAQHVLKWIQIPQEERIVMQSEKQEFFQQRCAERAMGVAAATSKQISYLRSLGCTIEPTSRLHASNVMVDMSSPINPVQGGYFIIVTGGINGSH